MGKAPPRWKIPGTLTAVLLVAIILACFLWSLLGGMASRAKISTDYVMSYADFVSIMLSAISVLMTILALFLAILGVIGWNAVASRVQEKTEQFLDEGFKEGNRLHKMLESKATTIMYEGVDSVTDSAGHDYDGEEKPK